ncbi:UNVERIFIED_CONTAM: hypothetical protein FKN15_005773 [Acipenser sinensis]
MSVVDRSPQGHSSRSISLGLKHFLHLFQSIPQLNSDPELGKLAPAEEYPPASPESPEPQQREARLGWLWSRALVGLLVLLALTVMVLLFLWNYQCIIVHRFCQSHIEERLPFPVFSQSAEEPRCSPEQ